MAAVTVVERSLLPADALALLAERAGVPLPPGWEREPGGADLLAETGLVDRQTGVVLGDVGPRLHPLAAPSVTVEVVLAPTAARPGLALAAVVALSDTHLVALLRRSGEDLVELTLAPASALAGSVQRVLEAIDGSAASSPLTISREGFVALSTWSGRFDVERFARDHDVPPSVVEPVARALGGVRRILRVVVTGDRSRSTPPVGAVLLYDTEDGWYDVTAHPDAESVVLVPRVPADVLPEISRLVAGGLA